MTSKTRKSEVPILPKERSLDGYPLYGYDKNKIKRHFYKDCPTIEEKEKHLADLSLKLDSSFVFNNTHEYIEDFRKVYGKFLNPHVLKMVYYEYKDIIDELQSHIYSWKSQELLRKAEKQGNEKSKEKPVQKNVKKKLRPNQRHRLECREVAKEIWKEKPEERIAHVFRDEKFRDVFKDINPPYVDDTLRDWIKDLCPNPRRGRPKKN